MTSQNSNTRRKQPEIISGPVRKSARLSSRCANIVTVSLLSDDEIDSRNENEAAMPKPILTTVPCPDTQEALSVVKQEPVQDEASSEPDQLEETGDLPEGGNELAASRKRQAITNAISSRQDGHQDQTQDSTVQSRSTPGVELGESSSDDSEPNEQQADIPRVTSENVPKNNAPCGSNPTSAGSDLENPPGGSTISSEITIPLVRTEPTISFGEAPARIKTEQEDIPQVAPQDALQSTECNGSNQTSHGSNLESIVSTEGRIKPAGQAPSCSKRTPIMIAKDTFCQEPSSFLSGMKLSTPHENNPSQVASCSKTVPIIIEDITGVGGMKPDLSLRGNKRHLRKSPSKRWNRTTGDSGSSDSDNPADTLAKTPRKIRKTNQPKEKKTGQPRGISSGNTENQISIRESEPSPQPLRKCGACRMPGHRNMLTSEFKLHLTNTLSKWGIAPEPSQPSTNYRND